MNLLLGFTLALLLAMVLIPPLMRLAGRLHLVDAPGARKVHAAVIPRVGGLAIGIASLATLLLWLPGDPLRDGYFVGALCLLVAGALDDRHSLGPAVKALSQLVAIMAFVALSGVQFDTLSLFGRLALPPWFGVAVTVLFLLFVTNAVNLSDGLDGLAGGLTLLSCAALAMFANVWNEDFVHVTAVLVAGALLGFLRYNTWPARVFMGDAGSQFLGFTIGALAVHLTQAGVAPLPAALPLLLVGMPLVDTLAVMALRLTEHRPLFTGDRRHLHHRLMDLGFDHYEAVAVIYAGQCVMLALAWWLRYETDAVSLGVFALLVLGCVLVMGTLERRGWHWRAPSARAGRSRLAQGLRWLAAPHRLLRWSMRSACVAVTAYWLAVGFFAGPADVDVRWFAGALAVLMLPCLLWRQRVFVTQWAMRAGLYFAVLTAVYLDHFSPRHVAPLQMTKFVFLPVLVLAVMAAIRLSPYKRFGATPLDLLLVFGALALPNIPGLHTPTSDLGISVAKLFALSYAVEMIATLGNRLRWMLHSAAALFFLVVAFHGAG